MTFNSCPHALHLFIAVQHAASTCGMEVSASEDGPSTMRPRPEEQICTEAGSTGGAAGSMEAAPSDSQAKKAQKNNNTSIYITGLPDDATVAEVAEEFKRCGIIRDNDEGQPRVKLYRSVSYHVPASDAAANVCDEVPVEVI
jgi:hypothetical protein